MKKLIVALLGINALLIALLTAQAAQAKVKTYDAVKLLQYEQCLHFKVLRAYDDGIGRASAALEDMLSDCSYLKP